jgi:hypothetical protein
MRTPWFLTLAVVVTVSGMVRSAPPETGDPSRLDTLISQLGSRNYKEREEAAAALDGLGSPALDSLKTALQHRDAEVRRRASLLAERIQKRLLTAELLQPHRVHVVFKDRPVLDAIEDFSQLTGVTLQVSGAKTNLWGRKITLDTGETTFWDAYEQFCRRAGLFDRGDPPGGVVPEPNVRIWNNARGQGPGQGRVIVMRYPEYTGSNPQGGISLIDSPPVTLPTCQTGAVRFRAVPSRPEMAGRKKDDVFFILEVMPEPKLSWQSIVDMHLEQAVDEHGQRLLIADGAAEGNGGDVKNLIGNRVLILDESTGQIVNDMRDLPICFKPGHKPSHQLREIKGTVTAHVQTPAQALIAVDDIFRSIGRLHRGPDGEALKVLEVSYQTNGYVKLRLQFEDPNQGQPSFAWARKMAVMRGNRVWVQNGVMLRGGRTHTRPANDGRDLTWSLLDTKGESLQLAAGPQLVENPQNGTTEMQLTFRPREGQAVATKLVYSGRRNVIIEVPFTLKDVPLVKATANQEPSKAPILWAR